MMHSLLPPELTALARRVIEENAACGRRVALAESCTGGLVAAALTEIAGSSAVVERGFVTYSNDAKSEMLGVTAATNAEFESDASLDSRVESLRSSLDTIRSQSSSFGLNLSIVQNRQDFTKNMINTLQTGSDNLVLADANEEAANLLSLQTRQQLSQTALSLASQADQGVLRLF